MKNFASKRLTLKHREMHGCVVSTGYWCPGAKAPGNQYPQCRLNIHCIGPVSYKNIAHKVNSIRKWKNWPSHLRVNGAVQTSLQCIRNALLFLLHWPMKLIFVVKSLVPGKFGCSFENYIFNLVLLIGIFRSSYEPMMTDHQHGTVAFSWKWCHRKWSRYQTEINLKAVQFLRLLPHLRVANE